MLKVDADQVTAVPFTRTSSGIQISTKGEDVNVFITATGDYMQKMLEERRRFLMDLENVYAFNPAENPADLETLHSLLE